MYVYMFLYKNLHAIYIRIYVLIQEPIGYFHPVGWDCKIHRLYLCRRVRPPPTECPGYNTKQSDNPIYPTPPLGQDMTQGQFLSGV